jgi:hypothetical protein
MLYRQFFLATLLVPAAAAVACAQEPANRADVALPYCVVDSGHKCVFGATGQLLKVPRAGEPFFGQDGQYRSHPFRYRLSGDGLTVYDENTGLTWQRSPKTGGGASITRRDKLTLAQAQKRPALLNAKKFGGYDDWRLPSIKELYSLIDFQGMDPSGYSGTDTTGLRPFLDTKYFQFVYGDVQTGERIIDSQYATSTLYVNKAWRGFGKLFGVNFADGRIKGYDLQMPGGAEKTFFAICVRGNKRYGVNDFQENGDKTISDRATGLMWAKEDSGKGMNWQEALAWAQAKNGENYLGHNDWRLPSAKELQSIVDYTRSPDTTRSAAIDPLFTCTQISNEAGQADYPCYWSATTHGSAIGRAAVYVAFGRAMGYMQGAWRDAHGAGAQRSDPKAGDPSAFPYGHGPQGDAIRINNYVRLVRTIDSAATQFVEADVHPLPRWRPQGGFAGGPAGQAGRGPGGPGGGMGPQPGYHLIARYAVERLNFTPEQQQQISALEKETKAALDKILTPEQRKILNASRPPELQGGMGRPNQSGGPPGPGPGAGGGGF